MSRRLPQPEDEVYQNPFEKNGDPGGPPEVVIADPTEPQPIPIGTTLIPEVDISKGLLKLRNRVTISV